MSVRVMARVWAYSQQSGGSLLLMLALADFANDEDECWPSIPVLAHKARLTEREIRYLLPKLEQAGELRLSRSNGGRNRRNRYIVTVSENPEDISLKDIQGKIFTEICDTKTLKPTSGALNRHRPVNKAVNKKRSPLNSQKGNPQVKEFILWFAAEYGARRKHPYHVRWKVHGTLIKDLLGLYDLPTLKGCAIALLESDDNFLAQTDRGIGILSNQINKLLDISHPAATPAQSDCRAPRPEALSYQECAND